MPQQRPRRVQRLQGIGVDQMGAIGDSVTNDIDLLRLENLDTDIPPDEEAVARTRRAATTDDDNSYLPFTGQKHLRLVAAEHVSRVAGVPYSPDQNCVISSGGLSGILNVLLATIDEGDEVIVTDPTYIGLTNRIVLAGGLPKYVPFVFDPSKPWKIDQDALRNAVTPRTKAMLLMSPSMPSGGYFDKDDWHLVAELCVGNDLWLILDTAMERLVFDGREVIHPAGLPGMAERTITIGSSAKELRMIGWRVGWIVGPDTVMADIATVSMANVVVPVGIAQDAVAIALEKSQTTLQPYVEELQARRDKVISELEGLPIGIPAGGWSLLLRVSDYGFTGQTASERLLKEGVCATGMKGWGTEHGAQYVRFVFSNEPVNRLHGLGSRVRAALGINST
ncbi:aminotransferase [Pochonia chlamydosporia 170]|uniref:Aminotransferase n=1 Tax=Pochonia chlamydosporia 170 TaxID=1380566 RepID=A0A179EZX1_METCM|nr:aminotransferase [Pochonia chlamydosporia 170]OAQ58708.1 aminotransferase [Pochonia chlamydosporia 170]